ncbi:hypothetical protein ACTXT7_008106 [Hymenolepis weldensis]
MQEQIIWKEWSDHEIYSESWTGEENQPTAKKVAVKSIKKIRKGKKLFIDSEYELYFNAISADSLTYRPSETSSRSNVFSRLPDILDIIQAFQNLPVNVQPLFNNFIPDLIGLMTVNINISVIETWNLLNGCLPGWIRTETNNTELNVLKEYHSVVFAEKDKVDELKLCENSRCGVTENFINQLKGTPQTVILNMKRQEPLTIPEENPPIPTWKRIRGPPISLRKDEERDPNSFEKAKQQGVIK